MNLNASINHHIQISIVTAKFVIDSLECIKNIYLTEGIRLSFRILHCIMLPAKARTYIVLFTRFLMKKWSNIFGLVTVPIHNIVGILFILKTSCKTRAVYVEFTL